MLIVWLSRTSAGALFLTLDELERSVAFAEDSRFDSVGAVYGTPDGTRVRGASGVLISENWVLTAGHVADNFSSFQFAIANDYDNPRYLRDVSEVIMHPGWPIGSTRPGGYPDLALFRLATPITEVSPAIRFRGPDPDTSYPKLETEQYYMAGFGLHGVANEEMERDSLKRAGSNMLERMAFDDVYLSVDSTDWVPYYQPIVDLEWKGTSGDSGGGWFQQVDDHYELTGISSYADGTWNRPTFTGAVRVTLYNDWIDSVIAPTAVPEPTTFAMLAVFATAAVLRSRRARSDNHGMQRSAGG